MVFSNDSFPTDTGSLDEIESFTQSQKGRAKASKVSNKISLEAPEDPANINWTDIFYQTSLPRPKAKLEALHLFISLARPISEEDLFTFILGREDNTLSQDRHGKPDTPSDIFFLFDSGKKNKDQTVSLVHSVTILSDTSKPSTRTLVGTQGYRNFSPAKSFTNPTAKPSSPCKGTSMYPNLSDFEGLRSEINKRNLTVGQQGNLPQDFLSAMPTSESKSDTGLVTPTTKWNSFIPVSAEIFSVLSKVSGDRYIDVTKAVVNILQSCCPDVEHTLDYLPILTFLWAVSKGALNKLSTSDPPESEALEAYQAQVSTIYSENKSYFSEELYERQSESHSSSRTTRSQSKKDLKNKNKNTKSKSKTDTSRKRQTTPNQYPTPKKSRNTISQTTPSQESHHSNPEVLRNPAVHRNPEPKQKSNKDPDSSESDSDQDSDVSSTTSDSSGSTLSSSTSINRTTPSQVRVNNNHRQQIRTNNATYNQPGSSFNLGLPNHTLLGPMAAMVKTISKLTRRVDRNHNNTDTSRGNHEVTLALKKTLKVLCAKNFQDTTPHKLSSEAKSLLRARTVDATGAIISHLAERENWPMTIDAREIITMIRQGLQSKDTPGGCHAFMAIPLLDNDSLYEDREEIIANLTGDNKLTPRQAKAYRKRSYHLPKTVDEGINQLKTISYFLDYLTTPNSIASLGFRLGANKLENLRSQFNRLQHEDPSIMPRFVNIVNCIQKNFYKSIQRHIPANTLQAMAVFLSSSIQQDLDRYCKDIEMGLPPTSLPALPKILDNLVRQPFFENGFNCQYNPNNRESPDKAVKKDKADRTPINNPAPNQSLSLPPNTTAKDFFNPKEEKGRENLARFPSIKHQTTGYMVPVCASWLCRAFCYSECRRSHLPWADIPEAEQQQISLACDQAYKNKA